MLIPKSRKFLVTGGFHNEVDDDHRGIETLPVVHFIFVFFFFFPFLFFDFDEICRIL